MTIRQLFRVGQGVSDQSIARRRRHEVMAARHDDDVLLAILLIDDRRRLAAGGEHIAHRILPVLMSIALTRSSVAAAMKMRPPQSRPVLHCSAYRSPAV